MTVGDDSRAMTAGTPAAEIVVDEELVQALLNSQAPELAKLAIEAFSEGFDNTLFRLGERYIARLPRRAMSAELVLGEQRCLPGLAAKLPLTIPAPVLAGKPDCGYPWHWSVVHWIAGSDADLVPLDADSAGDWLRFLGALHAAPIVDPPRNPYRGVPLSQRREAIDARLASLSEHTDLVTPEVRKIWRTGLESDAASAERSRTWVHGDLHPRNVLCIAGKPVAVIDWGDLCAGDPATDLASIWMLYPDIAQQLESQLAGNPLYDADIIWRGRGWAVVFATLLADTGRVDDARHFNVGAQTLAALANTLN